MSVKPRWLPSTFRCLWNFVIICFSLEYMGPSEGPIGLTATFQDINCIQDATQSPRALNSFSGT
jgi:hypothetical protein